MKRNEKNKEIHQNYNYVYVTIVRSEEILSSPVLNIYVLMLFIWILIRKSN